MKHSKLSLLLISCLFLFFIFSPSLAVDPTGVKVTGTTKLDIGDGTKTAVFNAAVLPSDADQTVKWSSSDSTVASVNKNGVVTAKSSGTATITATAVNGVKGDRIIQVVSSVKPGSLEIKSTSSTVAKGKKISLSYTFNQYTQPDNNSVTWSSLNENIATVDSSGSVRGVNEGTAKIKACSDEKKSVCATVNIIVKKPAKSIKITGNTAPIDIGKTGTGTLKLKAEVSPSGSSPEVIWDSNNKNVAIVNSKGVVTAKKTGTAIITATTADGTKLSATFTVKVVSRVQPGSLKISELTYSYKEKGVEKQETLKLGTSSTGVAKGKTFTLGYKFIQEYAPDNQGVIWESSNQNIAKITSNKIKFLNKGEVQISACSKESKNLCATHKFVVKDAAQSVSVSLSGSKTIDIGGTGAVKYNEKVTASVKPTGASQAVTWESSDTSIVSVNKNGVLTIKDTGKVTITATTTDGTHKTGKIVLEIVSKVQKNSLKLIGDENSVMQGDSIKLKVKFDQKKQPQNTEVKWESSDKSIATVDENGIVTGVKVGKVTIKACSKETTSICGTKDISVTGTTIKGTSTIDIGGGFKTETLEITLPSTEKVSDYTWEWKVSKNEPDKKDETVVDLIEDGYKAKVTGLAKGKATIKATANENASLTASIEIKVVSKVQPKALKIRSSDKSPFVIIVGRSKNFNAYFDKTIQITDPDNPNIVWSSTVKAVASVDNNGTVSGLMNGKAAIKVCSKENGNICSSINVEIYNKQASGVKITGKDVVQVGNNISLSASVSPSSARQIVKWASSNDTIATVDDDGLVKGLKAGKVTITATTTDGTDITTSFKIVVE